MWCLLPPGLYFSIKNGSIWPAWPDIPSGGERSPSPRTSILMVVEKMCFSGTSFFWNFSHIYSPKWLPKVPISWHLELQDDAMSLFRCIFGHPVFERPYSDLSLFSHDSGTRKLKKTCEKALKTLLATHRKKHTPRNHSWERKCPKIDPDWRSKWTPGRGHGLTIFARVAFWATPGHSNLKKHVPGMTFYANIVKMYVFEWCKNIRNC